MAFAPEQALALVSAAHGHGRLAHGLLVSGPDMVDLIGVAVGLAKVVNGWQGVETLDDLRKRGAVVLEPDMKSRQIGIDPVREVIRGVQFSAADGETKLVIFSEADRLTVPATNAFLKTLEEPPTDTLILLLTRTPEQLLDTVRSRCLQLPLFRPQAGGIALTPPQLEMVEALAAYFTGGKLNATRAMGLLGDFQRILAGLREQVEEDHKASLKEETEQYGRSTDGTWLKERKEYYENLITGACAEQRNSLIGILFTWLGELLRRRHHLTPPDLPSFAATTERVAATLTDEDLHARLKAIDEMRRNLATNVREVLALEVGFLEAFG